MVKNAWELVDAFFNDYNLVDHHLKSYNDFVDHRIQDIIDIAEPIVLEQGDYCIQTGQLEIRKPFIKEADGSKSKVFPTEARLRNLTYSAHMYLDMALIKGETEQASLYINHLHDIIKIMMSNFPHSQLTEQVKFKLGQIELQNINDSTERVNFLISELDSSPNTSKSPQGQSSDGSRNTDSQESERGEENPEPENLNHQSQLENGSPSGNTSISSMKPINSLKSNALLSATSTQPPWFARTKKPIPQGDSRLSESTT